MGSRPRKTSAVAAWSSGPSRQGAARRRNLQRRRKELAARLPHRRLPSLSLTLFLPLQMWSFTVTGEKEKEEIEAQKKEHQ